MLSVEASLRLCPATEEGKKGNNGDLHTCATHKHTHPHTETAVVILIRSSTMPNNCSHSKVLTNHWTEFHPLGTLSLLYWYFTSLHALYNVLLEITNATKKRIPVCVTECIETEDYL